MKLPLVTIVGRPNVGKSTFFNRVLRKREAIVHDQPGVTRDRHYATSDWNGHSFVLVDTGGFMPRSEDMIDMAIREQVEIALEETDAILFMVDRATGITDIDHEIAEKLKRSDKPVLLLVNKVDNELMESEGYAFYGLGLGEPHLVSSVQGRGIGDMLDQLVNHLPRQEAAPEEEEIRLAVIGKENAGKSSFVNTLLGEDRVIVTPIPGTTRDPIDSVINYQKRRYLLIDTAGLKRRAKVKENVLFYSQLRTMRSVQRADVVLYFVDATAGFTRQDQRVISDVIEARKGLVIAVNKWDLIEKNDRTMREWELDIRDKLGRNQYIPLIFTSVIEKKRLFKLMDIATEVYQRYHLRVSTSALNKKLLPIIKGNAPPSTRGKEIKINYVTQLQAAPPVFGFFGNHPKLIPDNYRRFLERNIRELWGFEGVPVVVAFKAKNKNSERE